MRKYRSERIQKTLIALSGAALASSLLFSSAQNIPQDHNKINYYQTKINSQIHKAVKAEKENKIIKKKKNKKEQEKNS